MNEHQHDFHLAEQRMGQLKFWLNQFENGLSIGLYHIHSPKK